MTRGGPLPMLLVIVVFLFSGMAADAYLHSPLLTGLITLGSTFSLVALIYWLNYLYERHVWNKGVCKKYGEDWEYFGSSLFSRGYKCRDQFIWLETQVPERFPRHKW